MQFPKGVHSANGTNGNEATGCILYQTRALCQNTNFDAMRVKVGFFILKPAK